MSFDRSTAEAAAAHLILGLAEVIYYISYDAVASAALIGVQADAYSGYVSEPGEGPVRTAALRTRLANLAGRMATFAKEGTWATSREDLMDELTDFEVATELLNGKNGPCLIGPDLVQRVPDESAHLLREVLAAAQTRLALDQGADITMPMLAAVSGVSEKTVRMAANPNNERPLKTIKQGAATFITAADAMEWLGRRADFKPTRYFVSEGSRPRLGTFWALTTHLLAVRTERGKSFDVLAKELGWLPDVAEAYPRIESGQLPRDLRSFQPRHLEQLARHLGIHEPVEFARESYPLIATAYGEALAKEQLT